MPEIPSGRRENGSVRIERSVGVGKVEFEEEMKDCRYFEASFLGN